MPTTPQAWTLPRFLAASAGHIESANVLLGHQFDENKPLSIESIWSTSVYLAHVATECVIKAVFLHRGGFYDTAQLAESNPKVHGTLFNSKHGHDLNKLATQCQLKQTMHGTWQDDECWQKLCAAIRPYSLRYGSESLSENEARQQVGRASAIFGTLAVELNRYTSPKESK